MASTPDENRLKGFLGAQALLVLAALSAPLPAMEEGAGPVDYLSFARGALPLALGGDAAGLRVGMEQAMAAIDGDATGFGMTPKPGGPDTDVWILYRLPAPTRFSRFSVPDIRETPSPSQTFFREIEIAGSDQGSEGLFETLALASLSTHTGKGQVTQITPDKQIPVRWVRLRLRGGISVERDKTFFEFSEIIGEGHQEPVPLLESFTGKWKGRGVRVELTQEGATVSGCYDDQGELRGTVSGNLLHATGAHRTTGVPSAFVLALTEDGGLSGVRSTNGAPFRLYAGRADPGLQTRCSEQRHRLPGCGDQVHGIRFGFDSAEIRDESRPLLDALYAGLADAPESGIRIVGHTSSEGSEAYNQDLSLRRAEAVVAALVARGMDAARISASGAGESRPIAENDTEVGRSLNRRVEIACGPAEG